MIKARNHRFYEMFFDVFIWWRMRLQFHEHQIKGEITDPGGSILVIGNHISWWDGFVARRMNQRTYKRRFHLMMLEEQLKNRLFLSRLGAFSIKKNHRDALNSLNYASDLLTDSQNMVVLFPQGRFQSLHQHPVDFEKGWFRIMQKAPVHCRLVFMANLVDYFDHPKPTLTTWLQPAPPGLPDSAAIEEAYNAFLKNAISQQNPEE